MRLRWGYVNSQSIKERVGAGGIGYLFEIINIEEQFDSQIRDFLAYMWMWTGSIFIGNKVEPCFYMLRHKSLDKL